MEITDVRQAIGWQADHAEKAAAPCTGRVVRMSGDTTKLTITADGRAIEALNVKVEAKRLLFSISPGGDTIACTLLLRDDKSYAGDCIDPQGGKGVMVMNPPKP